MLPLLNELPHAQKKLVESRIEQIEKNGASLSETLSYQQKQLTNDQSSGFKK